MRGNYETTRHSPRLRGTWPTWVIRVSVRGRAGGTPRQVYARSLSLSLALSLHPFPRTHGVVLCGSAELQLHNFESPPRRAGILSTFEYVRSERATLFLITCYTALLISPASQLFYKASCIEREMPVTGRAHTHTPFFHAFSGLNCALISIQLNFISSAFSSRFIVRVEKAVRYVQWRLVKLHFADNRCDIV